MTTGTCIVAYNDLKKKRIYMAGDSAGVSTNQIIIRKDKKVFQNKKMLFGFTSSFRMGQLLQYKLIIPKQKNSQSDIEYMSTDFIDAVKNCLVKNHFARIKNNAVDGGTFLVAYKNQIYTIYDDFQVAMSIKNHAVVGCGVNYALGALHALSTSNYRIASDIVNIALDTAQYFSTGVRSPFTVLTLDYK